MAEPWTASVYSKRAQTVAYDPDSKTMTVTWRDGRATVYLDVPEDHAVALSKAASVGQMINAEFTGQYQHRNIK